LKKRSAFTFLILLLWTGLSWAGPAEEGAIHGYFTAPRVGETRVISTTFLDDPFVNTQSSLALGYGKSSNIVTPLIEINGEPLVGLEGELLFATLVFQYRYAVRDWVAVWGQLNIAARLGNELQTMLAQGVNAATGFELGWLFRLYENERHLLSTGISVRDGSATIVDVAGWAEGLVEGEDVELVRKSPTLGTVGDLRYIYAANDFTAFQFLGQLAYGEAVNRSLGNELNYALGGLVSLDFNKKTGHAVGLALGYKYTIIPDVADEIIEDFQAALIGISYTGRPDFSIGLDLEFQRLPVKGIEDPASFFTAVISMQYFF
jgi:hypothetical protein